MKNEILFYNLKFNINLYFKNVLVIRINLNSQKQIKYFHCVSKNVECFNCGQSWKHFKNIPYIY
jgi:hypothetical protein